MVGLVCYTSGALADLQKALAEETSKQSASMQAQQKLEAQLRDQLLKNVGLLHPPALGFDTV